MREDLDPCLIEEPSALARHLGITLTSWKPDYARIEAPLSDFLLNRQGLPQQLPPSRLAALHRT